MSKNKKFWRNLLAKMDEGLVIPVIGRNLIEVEKDSETVLLNKLLAEHITKDCGFELPYKNSSLFDAVALVRKEAPSEDLPSIIHSGLKEIAKSYTPSDTLNKLASITDFKLYITLGFDSFLKNSIVEKRSLVDEDVAHLSFFPSKVDEDLPSSYQNLEFPVLFSLLGKSTAAAEFAVSEEDLLEWTSALLDINNRPQKLFDALQNGYILFIGCKLPDWLQRFFIRITRKERLSMNRLHNDTIVGINTEESVNLISFLDRYSPNTETLSMTPQEFVKELYDRWQETKTSDTEEIHTKLPADIPEGGVFLSYASDDVTVADRVYKVLHEKNTDVWFDSKRLVCGAFYNKVIEKNLGKCGVCLIVLSTSVIDRLQQWHDRDCCVPDKKPYFLKEWELIIARHKLTQRDGLQTLFIMPICVDEIDLSYHLIPQEIRDNLSIHNYSDGVVDESFIQTIKENVRSARRDQKRGGL